MNLSSQYIYVNYFCILLLFIVVWYNRRFIFRNYSRGGSGYVLLWGVLTFFSVFYIPFEGDSYNTMYTYYEYIRSGEEYHLEQIYFWLMEVLPNNYFIWRFVVWGIASYFTVLTFKKLKCESQLATLVFISCTLITCFYYLRNCLGLSILYYVTASIATYEFKEIKSLLFDVIEYVTLIWFTYYLHNSMPLYYCVVLIAWILPSNAYFVLPLALLWPFMVSQLPVVGDFLLNTLFTAEAQELSERYFEITEIDEFNFNGLMFRFLWLFPYAFIMAAGVISLKSMKESEKKIVKVFLFSAIILFSSSFILNGQVSYSLQNRLLNTSFLPLSFFIVKYLEKRRTQIKCLIFSILILFYYLLQSSQWLFKLLG